MPGYISSAFFTTRSHPRHNRIPAQTVLSPAIFITGGDYLKMKNVLAIDLGASNGRVILVSSDGKQIELKEIHRFPNSGIHIGDRIYTDILYLFQELITGMRKAFQATDSIDAFGIDAWGVDFALLDSSGELVVNPYHYRDSQANGMIRKADDLFGKGGLFSLTGVQNMWYNTVYQLLGIQKRNPRILNNAQKFLMIADILGYFFTERISMEYTGFSTTQMYDLRSKRIHPEILEKLLIPSSLFPELLMTGSPKGEVRDDVKKLLGIRPDKKLQMIATAQHDSASAAYAVPAEEESYIFINSGTWSVIGMITDKPVITQEVFDRGLSNEGAAFGKVKLVKTVMGMWLIQELRKYWERTGQRTDYGYLIDQAEHSDAFTHLIDTDDELFVAPSNMAEAINLYCSRTGQPAIVSQGTFYRTVMESLALKYRECADELERITGHNIRTLHLLGGASQEPTFCKYIANATKRTVLAGPVEATAAGNGLIQLRALGCIDPDIPVSKIIRNSFQISQYKPENTAAWDTQYQKYKKLCTNKHI